MSPRGRDRAAMVRVALIVVAIAAGAFVLNLFLFDAADSTGSAGRLSPRADDLPARVLTTSTGSATSTGPGAGTTAPGDDHGRDGRTTTSRGSTTSSARGTTTTSDDHGSGHSSGSGSGSDGSGRGRGGSDD